jgi:hypothetical protein
MVITTTMTLAALPMVSTPRLATSEWQLPNAALAAPAIRVRNTVAVGYGTSGFAASAIVADKHSRQTKPAAPPRGSR